MQVRPTSINPTGLPTNESTPTSSINQLINLNPHTPRANYPETQTSVIEAAFQEYTERKDIAILLINQHVCDLKLPAVPLEVRC
jgi:GTP cyclohydrolase I